MALNDVGRLPSGLPDGGFVILGDRQGSRKETDCHTLVIFLILIFCALTVQLRFQFCHIIKTCNFIF